MFTLGSVVVVGFIGLLIGAVIGYFLNPLLGGSPGQRKELEAQLAATEQRLADYRAEVARHFEETARKVNKLTEDYRDVHEHLVKSAVNLASNATGQQFIDTASQRNLSHQPSDANSTTYDHPPSAEAPVVGDEGPSAMGKEPSAAGNEEPSATGKEPSASNEEPLAMGEEPSAMGEGPSAMGEGPSAMGKEPSAAGNEEPSATGKEPSATGKEPSAGSEKPSATPGDQQQNTTSATDDPLATETSSDGYTRH